MLTMSQWQNSLDPNDPENKDTLAYFDELAHRFDVLRGSAKTTLTDLLNAAEFSETIDQLKELAEVGELTTKKLEKATNDDIDSIEKFKEALKDVDGATFQDVIQAIIDMVEKAKEKIDDGAQSLKDFAKALKTKDWADALELLDKIVSKQEKIAEAFNKIQINGSLTAQEAKELVQEIPDLFEYLEKTANGYVISTDNFNAVNDSIIGATKDTLKNQIDAIQEEITSLKRLQNLEQKVNLDNGKNAALIEEYYNLLWDSEDLFEKLNLLNENGLPDTSKIPEAIQQLNDSLVEPQFMFELLEKAFDQYYLNEIFDDAKSKITDYNKSIQSLDDAIKTLGEGTLLTYNEMIDLVDMFPELKPIYDAQGDGYTIAIDNFDFVNIA